MISRAQRVFAASTLAVDRETRQTIDECWDVTRAEPLDVLLELVGPADSSADSPWLLDVGEGTSVR